MKFVHNVLASGGDEEKRRIAHELIASSYAVNQKNAYMTEMETRQVAGWPGRYRTRGTINKKLDHYCEVLTQEKDGKIEGIGIELIYPKK